MSKRKTIFILKDVAIVAGVGIVYFLGAKLGLSLAYANASVTPVWPPTGLAIAAVLWLGYRATPGVFLGALAANYLLTDVSFATTSVISVGNTLEAVVAVYLLGRFVEARNPFNRAFDVLKFVVFAAVISTAVAATIGNVALCVSGHENWGDFSRLWLTWWSGDGVGALIVTPLILSWLEKPVEKWRAIRWTEFAMLLVLLSLFSITVYTSLLLQIGGTRPWGHVTTPLLVWAAFRFGPRGVSTAMLPLSAIAIWGTIHRYGAFSDYGPNEALLFLQAYVANLAITALALAAIVTERKHAGRHLAGSLSVTRILAEAPALGDAVPRIIQRICDTFEWEVGAMWRFDDGSNVLKCFKVWP
ncbi:MAG TPA: MASE1 domain-containing protein, partial [Pyrinomonadaceae bacterium]|nr:MASE1 domain-containing protein [Pyrinomonadaceae bacterium]